jgi:predicted nucleotidyltransferase
MLNTGDGKGARRMAAYEKTAIREKLDLIRESVLDVAPDTEAIYLFGSYAYGTPHGDSDLDIFVVVPDSSANPIDLNAEIRNKLYNKLHMPMDLIVKKSAAFHRMKQTATLDKIIARDGVVLYGQ